MAAGIGVLEIHKQQIRLRQDGFERLPRNRRRSIERPMDTGPAEDGEELAAEGRIKQRLPAGKRHAAAGNPVEIGILHQLVIQLAGGGGTAAQRERSGRTNLRARAAAVTEPAPKFMAIQSETVRTVRADGFAAAAGRTACRTKQQLRRS